MREIGETTEPARTYKEVVALLCDLCGERSPDNPGLLCDEVSWSRDHFDVVETALYLKEGSRYPDGSSYTYTEIDICPECFRAKLIPWLKSQGIDARQRNVDF